MTSGGASRVAGPPGGSASNQGPSHNSHVKVVLRIRPQNQLEINGNYRVVVQALDEHMLIFDPKEQSSPGFFHGRRRRGRDLLRKANKDMRFAFDRVFSDCSTNQEVYENTTKGILDGLLQGYNCSVFAYGATGAGKTFSMLGSPTSPGVIFLTMMDLYQRIDGLKEDKTCDVAVSYLEVYNEQIRDLLNCGPYLPIREDPQKGVIVNGLSLHKPTCADELFHMLQFGNQNRTQHPTDANAESSRSHAVFQVFVRQRDRTANLSASVCVGKMSLIDLAGSERATVTKNRGARFREGANINRSLLALGNVINALADGKNKGFVPYRNSKLTRLLKDSLGGNCQTVMIAAVSPSAMSYEDTYNTLKYANRAKAIKSNLKQNVVSVDFHVAKYAKIVEELRCEVTELKAKLSLYESGAVVQDRRQSLHIVHDEELQRLQNTLHTVFSSRMSIRKEFMELEGKTRDLTFNIHRKEKVINRVKIIVPDQVDRFEERFKQHTDVTMKRQQHIGELKAGVEVRIQQNNELLERAKEEIDVFARGNTPELLQYQLHCHHLEIELRDMRRQSKYLKKLCRLQHHEASKTERLVHQLLSVARRQFLLLKYHSLATTDVVQAFQHVCEAAGGEQTVAWADQSSTMDSTLGAVTNDSSLSTSQEASFNINSIAALPVLTAMDLTPKCPWRPHRDGSATTDTNTPNRGPGHTPGSARKRPQLSPRQLLHTDHDHRVRLPATPHRLDVVPEQSTEPMGQPCAAGHVVGGGSHTRYAGCTPCPKGALASCRNTDSQLEQADPSPVVPQSVGPPASDAVQVGCGNADLNSTFTQDADVFPHEVPSQAPAGVHCDLEQSGRQGHSRVQSDCDLNQTVVLTTPRVLTVHENSTSGVNTETVTKSTASQNSPPPGKCKAAQALDFNCMPGPSPGRLSFAEMVKSPAPCKPLSQVLTADVSSPRSPLMARENLPPFNPHHGKPGGPAVFTSRLPSAEKQVNFAPATSHKFKDIKSVSNLPRRHSEYQKAGRTADTLRRVGLPSVSGQPAGDLPGYMRPTKAASRRRYNHRRSMSHEGLMPKRVAQRVVAGNKENVQHPARTFSQSRSKSTSNFHRRGNVL